MKLISFLLIILCLEFISNSNSDDFTIEEVKRTIDLKQSIITIENNIRLKKNSFEDTFLYVVPKNNTYSLIRIIASNTKGKRLEMQKTLDDQDYDYYDILLQGSEEIVVKEDYLNHIHFLYLSHHHLKLLIFYIIDLHTF